MGDGRLAKRNHGVEPLGLLKRALLSVKTVEANLTRVYRKLGIRSRAGLARRLS